jgi:FkbM family methyltransferase
MTKTTPYHLVISPKTKLLNFFRRFLIFSGLDKKLSQFTKNKPASSLFVKLIPPNYLYKPATIRNVSLNGISFITDISDTVGHVVYFGIKDPGQDKLFKMASPGMTVLDVGTNIGLTALTFAKIVGDTGKVFAFEPDPYNHGKAKINIGLNDLKALSLYNIGLAEKEGTASLFNVNKTNRGMLRILQEDSENKDLDKTVISLTTLDRFVKEHGIQKIDLIKIDVEGYEFNVLKGAGKTLLEYKPLLFIELDDNNLREQGETPSELIAYLQSFGYSIVDAVTNQVLNENSRLSGCHIDIICRIPG